MPHIHDKPGQHDLVVSMYIFRQGVVEPELLLHWHKKLNAWMQFGGHVELNENPWQAVEHELLEESGYELSQLKLMQPKQRLKNLNDGILHPQPFVINTHKITETHFHTGIDYAFFTDTEPLHDLAEGESTNMKWVSKEDLLKIPASEIFVNTKEICLFAFDEILPTWEKVPANLYK